MFCLGRLEWVVGGWLFFGRGCGWLVVVWGYGFLCGDVVLVGWL